MQGDVEKQRVDSQMIGIWKRKRKRWAVGGKDQKSSRIEWLESRDVRGKSAT